MQQFLLSYALFSLYSVIIVYFIYLLILLLSNRDIIRTIRSSTDSKFRELSGSEFVPPVSVLVPAYNEELTILETVRSLLSLNYPDYEVIVINDGSKDSTLKVLIDEFQLDMVPEYTFDDQLEASPVNGMYQNPAYPRLYVVDKNNGGKEDALNVGINISRFPLVATIDADSLLEKDAMLRLVRVYMENPKETIAIGGNVRVANGNLIEDGVVKEVRLPTKFLPMVQNIEYLKSFLGGRIGWSSLNGMLIVSGAFGLFRKDALIKVGGYRDGFPGEDMNIIIKLHKYMLDRNLPYRIVFCPDAVCWTQAPDTLDILGSQRKRWSRGTLKNIWTYRSMMFIPKYKMIGFLSMPYLFFFEMLQPYLRVTGFFALLGYCLTEGVTLVSLEVIAVFLLVNVLTSVFFSCSTLLIEEMSFRRYRKLSDLFKMMMFSMLMPFGYDQLNVWWKFMGHVELAQKKNAWGTMVRKSWRDEMTISPNTNPKKPTNLKNERV
jgi:cellulose synthase/poly-beta-1,6-N-acetylglucosamine synthase-like glycosyltransferase